MSLQSQLDAAHKVMAALVANEEVDLEAARVSGYDVHVLQRYMDLVQPQIGKLPGFLPLLLCLRGNWNNLHIESLQKLQPFNKNQVLRVMRLFDNKTRKSKVSELSHLTVEVYLCMDGKYLVTVSDQPHSPEKRDEAKPHQKLRNSTVSVCTSAVQLSYILNPMQLQIEQWEHYDDEYLEKSPLLVVAEGLQKIISSLSSSMSRELRELTDVTDSMRGAYTFK